MTTFDEVLVKASSDFMDKAKKRRKTFFRLAQHYTYARLDISVSEIWFAHEFENKLWPGRSRCGTMDDAIGALLKHIEDIGEADNTIVIFTTDNGAEVFTWPDGGMTPFRGTKGTVFEGGFRVPAIIKWPGHIKAGSVENGIMSGLDWFPTLMAAAGNPNITDNLLKGVNLGGYTYKNHLDGYNQIDLITGKGPSARHEIFYFGGPALGAIRLDDFKFQFLSTALWMARGKSYDRYAYYGKSASGSV